MTTVQDCVSTFVSLTPLDIFKENSGKIFWQDGRSAGVAPLDVSSCAGGDKNIYFKTHFLKPNECCLCLNLTRAHYCGEKT